MDRITEIYKVLFAAKSLRGIEGYKNIYLGPDLTEAERLLDFQLRKKRNEMNNKLEKDSPFRYAIRGNQIVRFKKA